MDIGNIAELNTFLVLDAVRSRGHVTRRELGLELGLSNASVSRIVKRLLAAGLIAEEPGAGAVRGRIPAVLRFVGPPGGRPAAVPAAGRGIQPRSRRRPGTTR